MADLLSQEEIDALLSETQGDDSGGGDAGGEAGSGEEACSDNEPGDRVSWWRRTRPTTS